MPVSATLSLPPGLTPVLSENPVSLGRACCRQFASFGHVLLRFFETRHLLLRQVHKHPENFPALQPWLSDAPPTAPSLADALFASVLILSPAGPVLQTPFMPPAAVLQVLSWSKALHPTLSADAGLSPIPLPADASAALWPALLRLGPLRAFWEREMRRNLFGSLLAVLPQAWLLDPTPIPHGAVIPGLDIPSWSHFPPPSHAGLLFSVSPAWRPLSPPRQATTLDLTTTLDLYPETPGILTATAGNPDDPRLIALYQKQNQRTDLLTLLHLRTVLPDTLQISPVIA